jgi:hypothetical protein
MKGIVVASLLLFGFRFSLGSARAETICVSTFNGNLYVASYGNNRIYEF